MIKKIKQKLESIKQWSEREVIVKFDCVRCGDEITLNFTKFMYFSLKYSPYYPFRINYDRPCDDCIKVEQLENKRKKEGLKE